MNCQPQFTSFTEYIQNKRHELLIIAKQVHNTVLLDVPDGYTNSIIYQLFSWLVLLRLILLDIQPLSASSRKSEHWIRLIAQTLLLELKRSNCNGRTGIPKIATDILQREKSTKENINSKDEHSKADPTTTLLLQSTRSINFSQLLDPLP
jgi:hypothetical protein